MEKTERIRFQFDISRVIELLAKQIYQSPLALLRENCQNAYDAILMRSHTGEQFAPEITVEIRPLEIIVSDNGVGMTRSQVENNFWKAGSSGKNNAAARAAGVVGTFGIGAMANFGVATKLVVETEPIGGDRFRSIAIRENLSASEECIDIEQLSRKNSPGTTITAVIDTKNPIDVAQATTYLRGLVRFLPVRVVVNGELISGGRLESLVERPTSSAYSFRETSRKLGVHLTADVDLQINKNAEVWLTLLNIHFSGQRLVGEIYLKQSLHQIQTFRSKFALASVPVSSVYQLGGAANLLTLQPTAGREALTTDSVQLLQTIITECEHYISQMISGTKVANSSTLFMNYVVKYSAYGLCDNLLMRREPGGEQIEYRSIKEGKTIAPYKFFAGEDKSLIKQFATEDEPLLVGSDRQPRKRCEENYLRLFCTVETIADSPTVLSIRSSLSWSFDESSLALKLASILQTEYFVAVDIAFGKISHGLPLLVDLEKDPPLVVLDTANQNIAVILEMYREDFNSLNSILRDFARNLVFPRIESLVPSSTKEGAEAFLRLVRRPKDVFEYDYEDQQRLEELIRDYAEGKYSFVTAASAIRSVQTNVQIVSSSQTTAVANVVPDVLENDDILSSGVAAANDVEWQALPPITRLSVSSDSKLLTIDPEQRDLKGYRCFVAVADRVRQERGDFFFQPHRTEIVWAGQKALFIFTHHSGEFSLYYELQSGDVFSDTSGGGAFPTSTIVIRNQIYIPVPEEIKGKFTPSEGSGRRFEVRSELLYPEA